MSTEPLSPPLEALARAQAMSVDASYERLWIWREHAAAMAEALRAEGFHVVAMTAEEKAIAEMFS